MNSEDRGVKDENTAYRGYSEPNRPREEATFFFPIGVCRNVEEENVEFRIGEGPNFDIQIATFDIQITCSDLGLPEHRVLYSRDIWHLTPKPLP